jgi:hypothetical protein
LGLFWVEGVDLCAFDAQCDLAPGKGGYFDYYGLYELALAFLLFVFSVLHQRIPRPARLEATFVLGLEIHILNGLFSSFKSQDKSTQDISFM